MTRPLKGTPTPVNIYALYKLFGEEDLAPNRISNASLPHIRRCLAAGLCYIEPKNDPFDGIGSMFRLTAAGKAALAADHVVSTIRERDRGENAESCLKPNVSAE